MASARPEIAVTLYSDGAIMTLLSGKRVSIYYPKNFNSYIKKFFLNLKKEHSEYCSIYVHNSSLNMTTADALGNYLSSPNDETIKYEDF